jgi:hypothetical protein
LIIHGGPITVTPVSDTNLVTLYAGYYQLAFDGLSRSVRIQVPDTNVVVNAADIVRVTPNAWTATEFYTKSQVDALITNGVEVILAGTNISVSPAGGRGAVTISSTAPGGGGGSDTNDLSLNRYSLPWWHSASQPSTVGTGTPRMVVSLGDSTSAGLFPMWSTRLAKIQGYLGAVGSRAIYPQNFLITPVPPAAIHNDNSETDTFETWWIDYYTVPNGSALVYSARNAPYLITANVVEVDYLASPQGGKFKMQISPDGLSWSDLGAEVNTYAATTNGVHIRRTNSTVMPMQARVLGTEGTATVLAGGLFDGSRDGLILNDFSGSGRKFSEFLSVPTNIIGPILRAWNPPLVIQKWANGGASDVEASMPVFRTLKQNWMTNSDSVFVGLHMLASNSPTHIDLNSVLRSYCSQYNWPYFDGATLFGTWSDMLASGAMVEGNIHLQIPGDSLLGDSLLKWLDCMNADRVFATVNYPLVEGNFQTRGFHGSYGTGDGYGFTTGTKPGINTFQLYPTGDSTVLMNLYGSGPVLGFGGYGGRPAFHSVFGFPVDLGRDTNRWDVIYGKTVNSSNLVVGAVGVGTNTIGPNAATFGGARITNSIFYGNGIGVTNVQGSNLVAFSYGVLTVGGSWGSKTLFYSGLMFGYPVWSDGSGSVVQPTEQSGTVEGYSMTLATPVGTGVYTTYTYPVADDTSFSFASGVDVGYTSFDVGNLEYPVGGISGALSGLRVSQGLVTGVETNSSVAASNGVFSGSMTVRSNLTATAASITGALTAASVTSSNLASSNLTVTVPGSGMGVSVVGASSNWMSGTLGVSDAFVGGFTQNSPNGFTNMFYTKGGATNCIFSSGTSIGFSSVFPPTTLKIATLADNQFGAPYMGATYGFIGPRFWNNGTAFDIGGSTTPTITVTSSNTVFSGKVGAVNFETTAGGRIQIATTGATIAQDVPAGSTYAVITNWNFVGGAVRMSAVTNTGVVTVTNAGTYYVTYQLSSYVDATVTVEIALHRAGVEQAHLEAFRTFTAGSTPRGSTSFNGILTTTTNNTPVDVRIKGSGAATLSVVSQQLTLQRMID